MSDLIVLVPDKNMEASVRGILGRSKALGIRQLDHRIFVHPARDPGCLGQDMTCCDRSRASMRHALVLLDRDGCGREEESRDALEITLSRDNSSRPGGTIEPGRS